MGLKVTLVYVCDLCGFTAEETEESGLYSDVTPWTLVDGWEEIYQEGKSILICPSCGKSVR